MKIIKLSPSNKKARTIENSSILVIFLIGFRFDGWQNGDRKFSLSKLIFFNSSASTSKTTGKTITVTHDIYISWLKRQREEKGGSPFPSSPPSSFERGQKVDWIWPIRFDPGGWLNPYLDRFERNFHRGKNCQYTGWPFKFDYQIYPSNTLYHSFLRSFYRLVDGIGIRST